jgi:hypothetical protein
MLIPLLLPLTADVKQTPHRGIAAPSPWLWLSPSPLLLLSVSPSLPLRAVVLLLLLVLQYTSLPSPPPSLPSRSSQRRPSCPSLKSPRSLWLTRTPYPQSSESTSSTIPCGELQFVRISRNVRVNARAAPRYDACCKHTFQMFQMF